jgi:polyisoprenoid-binding protein YceI
MSTTGQLTIYGVTREVALHKHSISPAITDPWGNLRVAASVSRVIRRKDFGLTWIVALERGECLSVMTSRSISKLSL